MLKSSEQTNRSLHVLAIVTTVFLPATLVTGVFGMNVAGLPLTEDKPTDSFGQSCSPSAQLPSSIGC